MPKRDRDGEGRARATILAKRKPRPLESNANHDKAEAKLWKGLGSIEPPINPSSLLKLVEKSNALRPNLDAYATNIDGFGHRFEPTFDLEAANADEKIRVALYEQNARSGRTEDPTDDEVKAKRAELRVKMALERVRLTRFFDNACRESSFVTLRRNTRFVFEGCGNAYWELIRNVDGDPKRLRHLPPQTVRLCEIDETPVEVVEKERVGDLGDVEDVQCDVFFRRYVQIADQRKTFFKELGDPRLVSSKSGKVYEDTALMEEAEGKDTVQATEVIHFAIYSPLSPYGLPRWAGCSMEVLGNRAAGEVNYLYFDNKAVPPLIVTVSGGRLTSDSSQALKDFINNEIKGRENFHAILILEAEPAGKGTSEANGKMKIDVRPMTSAQNSDALFQNYDRANIEKVGQSFRLPSIVRGETRDFNKSTAEAALSFAEMQVFQPEREEFDFAINRRLLPLLDVRYHKFVSNAPVTRDPETMAEIIRRLTNANLLTPAEGRRLMNDIFNKEFSELGAAWTKQPLPLTLAGIPVGSDDPAPPKAPGNVSPSTRPASGEQPPQGAGQAPFTPRAPADEDLAAAAKKIIELRDKLLELDAKRAAAAFKADDEGVITLRVPSEEFRKWVVPTEA